MFLLFSVAGELQNVLFIFFLVLLLCALSFTDDISVLPQGPQFVEFPVRYFYVSLQKKKRI